MTANSAADTTGPRTLYDKIFDAHVVDRQPDGTCLLYIDRHLVHEVTSPQAFEGLRMAGRRVHSPERTIAVPDHNVPTTPDRVNGIENPEGRVQVAERAVFPPGEAKEDWAIFRALSAVIGMPLPFNSLRALRAAMYAEFPHLAQIDQIVPSGIDGVRKLAQAQIKTDTAPLTFTIGDFYLTNPIARASAIMAECSQMQSGLKQAAE